VFFDAFGATGVVEEEGEVEDEGVFEVMEEPLMEG
jgi:hypothetical protein